MHSPLSGSTTHLKFLLPQLWQNKTTTVTEYFKYSVNTKNQDKWQELIGYLEKHQPEIINYNRRRRAGKTIDSGRIEKEIDLTVRQRQKNKGISLRPLGSRLLSLLKVAKLNGQ